MKPQPNVLLIESDPNDERLMLSAILNSGIACKVQVARDSVEARHMLFENGMLAPAIILLDLNIANLNGFELLTLIRGREDRKRSPVVILTSPGQRDMDKNRDLHVNSYVEKDLDAEIFDARVKLILYYWFAVNKNVIT